VPRATVWVPGSLKGLRIYRQGPAGVTALIAAGTFQDAQLDDRNGLYRCATDVFALAKLDALPESAEADADLPARHGLVDGGQLQDLWRNPTSYREQLLPPMARGSMPSSTAA
jgi:hypothetical protein